MLVALFHDVNDVPLIPVIPDGKNSSVGLPITHKFPDVTTFDVNVNVITPLFTKAHGVQLNVKVVPLIDAFDMVSPAFGPVIVGILDKVGLNIAVMA